MRLRCISVLSGVLVLGAMSAYVPAAVLVEHVGANDPTSEGWSAVGIASVNGPVINDLGTGLDAWAVGKANGTSDSLFYEQFITATATATAQTSGWRLSGNIRVADVTTTNGTGPAGFGYFIPTSPTSMLAFILELSAAADGDPIARVLASGDFFSPMPTEITLDGFGTGYHLYEFVYNPMTMTADFLVDGTAQLSGLSGVSLMGITAPASGRVAWGIPSNFSVGGQGNYNLVRLATPEASAVPEPASLALMGLGGLGLIGGWYRKGRKTTIAA